MPRTATRFAIPAALVGLCGLVLFVGLGDTGAIDAREARDLEVARELVDHREILTPLLGREALFEKPVVAYAPDAVVRLLRRDDMTGSRLWRAALAALLVVLTGAVGARHFGARAGWLASVCLTTCVALPLAARTDGTILLATVAGWIGAAGLADAAFGRERGRALRLVVAYVALAGAFVCAGPLSALWPFGALAAYLFLANDLTRWGRIQALAGVVVIAGIGFPWYAAMSERYGYAFLAHAPAFPYAVEPRAPWYGGIVFAMVFPVVGFFPWSALLPGALLHAATWWRFPRRPRPPAAGVPGADPVSRERDEEHAAHFFIACLVTAVAPILVYPRPPLGAALPALPAAAILCGRFLDHLIEDPARVAEPLRRATVSLLLLGTVLAALLAVLAGRIREAQPELRLLAAALLLAAWAPFLADFMGRKRLAAALLALPVAVGAPLVASRLLPAMEPYLNARSVALAMADGSPPRAPLVLVEEPPPSLRLYTRRNLVVAPELGEDRLRALRAADGLVYLAFRPGLERRVARTVSGALEILQRTPVLVLARVQLPKTP